MCNTIPCMQYYSTATIYSLLLHSLALETLCYVWDMMFGHVLFMNMLFDHLLFKNMIPLTALNMFKTLYQLSMILMSQLLILFY